MIGVLDCNNFFVSCERLFRPDLRDKPVVVLSANDGCVVARSQEVKDMEIPMGVPYFKVKDILDKEKTFIFSSNFTLYRDISRRVFEVMKNQIGTIEQYSIDEAFFSVPADDDPHTFAASLKDKVEQQVGVPVSIGIGFSKTQAKYANDLAKREDGIHIISGAVWKTKADTIQLSDIWGVGHRLAIRYRAHGLVTVRDLMDCDRSRVERIFGIAGLRLRDELSGIENKSTEKTSVTQQKSLMSSRSFKDASSDIAVVKDAVAYHVRHAASDLREMALKASFLRVSIHPSRYSDFVLQGASAEIVIDNPTNDTMLLNKTAQNLLDTIFVPGIPYKKAGIIVGGFVPEAITQAGLFEQVTPNTENLMQIVDTLNTKADREIVTIGSGLKSKKWQSRTDSRSPLYTTSWRDIVVAKS